MTGDARAGRLEGRVVVEYGEMEIIFNLHVKGRDREVTVKGSTVGVDGIIEGRPGFVRYFGSAEAPKHMCGLSGYNPMQGDRCPRCDYDNEVQGAYQEARKQLVSAGVLKE